MLEPHYTPAMIRDLLLRSDLACMRGVLAIFRKQTDYEKSCRATVNQNGYGFAANHAKAGSELALFMSCMNEDGILRRTLSGSTSYNGDKISRMTLCRKIALRYTEQLATEANKTVRKMEAAMVAAHEDEEFGRYERESSRFERDNYEAYHTWPA